MASGTTARPASCACSPRSISTRLALGESCRPAPASSRRSARSSITTRKPDFASASAAVSPPMPAPAMKIGRAAAPARSGDLVLQDAFGRACFAGLEIGGIAIQRRAIGTDDLVVVAEIEENMGMVEGRVGAHAHEFLRSDFNHRNAGVIVKVRDDVVGHNVF